MIFFLSITILSKKQKKELELLINAEWQQLKQKLVDRDIKELLLKLKLVFD